MQTNNIKRFVIVFSLIAGLVIAGFVLYNIFVFKVTRVEPDPKTFPTITPYIDIYFSKPIDRLDSFKLNEEDSGKVTISDRRIRFTPSSLFSDGTTYTLEIKGVQSKSGDRLDYIYKFTAQYMDYNDVPKAIQEASVEKSSSGQKDDPFFNNYFPMQTADFQIEHPYDETETNDRKVLYVTFLREVYNYDTNTRYTLTNQEADSLRAKFIEYIKSRGATPENYDIYYSNEYLNSKYPQSDSHE